MKSILIICVVAMLLTSTMGESVIEKLKEKIESGVAAAPCDKAPAGPPAPRQFLDQRLPHVVDDYHPPVGGFNPTDIPSKEVDVAARKILREIQKAEAEAKANGDAPAKPDDNGILTTEEHKALKQLLLDSDILVRAAAKSLSENGPIEAAAAKKVATSAIKKAAKLEKKAAKKKAKKAKKAAKKAKKAAKKAAKAAAKKTKKAAKKAAAAKPAAKKAVTKVAPAAAKSAKAAVRPKVGNKAPQNKLAAGTKSAKTAERKE